MRQHRLANMSFLEYSGLPKSWLPAVCAVCASAVAAVSICFCVEKGTLVETVSRQPATLYTDREIVENVSVYTKDCPVCRAVFYPHPKDQGVLL